MYCVRNGAKWISPNCITKTPKSKKTFKTAVDIVLTKSEYFFYINVTRVNNNV